MRKSVALGLMISCSVATLAADRASAGDWSQLYIGAGLGADVISTELGISIAGGAAAITGEDLSTAGFGASLRVGGDYQVNNWLVIGAFANVDWTDAETSLSLAAGGAALNIQLVGIDHAWSVGGRAGYLVTPNTLSYYLLGYTEVSFDDISIAVPGVFAAALDVPTARGIVVGSGFEHRLSSNLSLTAEYRASFLDQQTLFSIPGVIDVTTESVLHTGRLGFAYRFGGHGGELQQAPAIQGTWTGFYAGIGTGLSGVDGELDVNVPIAGLTANADGIYGGDYGGTLMIGYDYRANPNFVLGVFGAVDKTLQDANLALAVGGVNVASVELPQMSELYTIAARAGYLVASDTLVYGLIGYSHMNFDDLEVSVLGVPVFNFEMPSFSGVTYGGGFETLLGNGFSLRGEYRYTDTQDETLFAIPGVLDISTDADVHTARVLVSYRWDDAPRHEPLK